MQWILRHELLQIEDKLGESKIKIIVTKQHIIEIYIFLFLHFDLYL